MSDLLGVILMVVAIGCFIKAADSMSTAISYGYYIIFNKKEKEND